MNDSLASSIFLDGSDDVEQGWGFFSSDEGRPNWLIRFVQTENDNVLNFVFPRFVTDGFQLTGDRLYRLDEVNDRFVRVMADRIKLITKRETSRRCVFFEFSF